MVNSRDDNNNMRNIIIRLNLKFIIIVLRDITNIVIRGSQNNKSLKNIMLLKLFFISMLNYVYLSKTISYIKNYSLDFFLLIFFRKICMIYN